MTKNPKAIDPNTEALIRVTLLYQAACANKSHPRFIAMLDRRISDLSTPVKLKKAAEAKAPA